MSESLAEALPKEQARVREILAIYDKVPGGALAASMMRLSLTEAERAAAAGDVVSMARAYEDLKGYEL